MEKIFSKFVKKLRTVLWRLAIKVWVVVFWRHEYDVVAI